MESKFDNLLAFSIVLVHFLHSQGLYIDLKYIVIYQYHREKLMG